MTGAQSSAAEASIPYSRQACRLELFVCAIGGSSKFDPPKAGSLLIGSLTLRGT